MTRLALALTLAAHPLTVAASVLDYDNVFISPPSKEFNSSYITKSYPIRSVMNITWVTTIETSPSSKTMASPYKAISPIHVGGHQTFPLGTPLTSPRIDD